ncbi:C39 family peptidase [Halobaculum sp. MBLA0143]|uniref:C39 family peptidase n=1 Tax=Halobaculum sp. MBLA0143 TaxID=3079933 RepID=UPI003523A097
MAFGLGTVGTATASPDTVSVGDARAAAAATVRRAAEREQFAAWEGAGLGQPTTFHARNAARGPAAVPAVYVFPVQEGGRDLGYVTAGARPEWADVIEYSTATPPQRRVAATRAHARRHGARPTDRLLYHGGVKYGVELADGRGVNVRNGRAAPLTEIDPSRVAAQPTGVTTADTTTDVTADSHYYDWLWEVPAWTESDTDDPWDDWDGCVPIAASMALAYHEDVGESVKEVYIDDLHEDMNTNDAGSTFPTDIDNGINEFDTGDDSYNGRNIYLWSHPNFTKQEIGAGRPFLLNMTSGDQADDRNQNYGNHTVTVVGYDEGGDELILHDTWDDTTHHFDWGSWLAASYTKITVE